MGKRLSINIFKDFFIWLFNSIYKQNCCVCGCSQAQNFLCKNCAKNIEFLSGFVHKKISGVDVYSATLYEGTMKKLIQSFKFNNKMDISHILARILSDFYLENMNLKNCVVIPLPSHKNRIKKRGYNHTFLFVKEFCELSNLKYNCNILLKIKNTKPHYNLNTIQRRANIRDSFSINLNEYRGETVLLVDDIVTTGSTLEEAIKELKKNGIEKIVCLTCAKT